MIKKRLLSFLGAAAITAALTFAVVSLSPSNGFTSGTMQEGLCYEATGVAPDAIVASLNGNGASADLVAYRRHECRRLCESKRALVRQAALGA